MTDRVVMFSGGVGSWATAQRVAERVGTEGMTLLFADTLMEDEDLYRFIDEAAGDVGAPLVKIADGRNIWQVFRDERFLGNTRVDPCSKILKRNLLRRWLEEHCDPATTVVYLGIDWTEAHRFTSAKKRWAPWTVEAPLCEKPYIDKRDALATLRLRGIRPPRLYEMGFPHNNCGGGCVKAGQAQFARLLQQLPDRYAEWERNEEELRQELGDVAILRDRTDGTTKPLTLADLRRRIEASQEIDTFDWGGCGCVA
jgi:3'-phosphoadenosine 5'-phosphosulfate sulfotransferase (PAPS reductase)/FAD synthetase